MSTTIIYIGEYAAGQLIETQDCTITFNEYGIASAVLHFESLWDDAPALVSAVGVHPDFNWLFRKTADIKRAGGNTAEIVITFEGVSPEQDEDAEPVYSLENAVTNAPIETHPDFETFAGTWTNDGSNPNGARFITDVLDMNKGKFLGFVPTPGEANPKAGVTDFLVPSLIYSETRTYSGLALSALAIDMNKIGKIDTPPPSNVLPTVASPRNWLLFACNASQVGGGIKVDKKWRLSGPRGWDEDIYDYA